MEESNHGTLELGTTAGVDGGGAEGLPDDGLADVGGDEEGDPRAETVALLEELVEHEDDEAGNDELRARVRSTANTSRKHEPGQR